MSDKNLKDPEQLKASEGVNKVQCSGEEKMVVDPGARDSSGPTNTPVVTDEGEQELEVVKVVVEDCASNFQ